MQAYFDLWTKLNPLWDHVMLDDEEIDAFVAANYNESVLQAFRALPIGVMKADAFRCARASPRLPDLTQHLL
jgi:mannosyltransferase OCH1-like enzyme